MLSEKNFRKLIILMTLLTLVIVFFSTYRYYKNLPSLEEVKTATQTEMKGNLAMPLLPFEVFSMDKESLLIKFGKGSEGTGEGYDNMYIDYKQEWFGQKVDTRYFYGDYKRLYQIILEYPVSDATKIYENMKKELGEPIYDGLYSEEISDEMREMMTYWIKDSVRYTLVNYEDEDLCMVTMNLQYFANVEGYEVGQRPTEIQRINSVKLGNDSSLGNIILIGDKPEYTSTLYEKLYIVYGGEEGTTLCKFNDEYNGGFYPKLEVKDVDNDGENEAIIKADNEYTTFYTIVEYKNGELTVSYAGEKNPLEDSITENREDISEEDNIAERE